MRDGVGARASHIEMVGQIGVYPAVASREGWLRPPIHLFPPPQVPTFHAMPLPPSGGTVDVASRHALPDSKFHIQNSTFKIFPMRFSVIIPAFKMGKFIGEALDSIGAQTCRDWEVIVVEDCGPEDGTEAIVMEFAKAHRNHKLFDGWRHADTCRQLHEWRRFFHERGRQCLPSACRRCFR